MILAQRLERLWRRHSVHRRRQWTPPLPNHRFSRQPIDLVLDRYSYRVNLFDDAEDVSWCRSGDLADVQALRVAGELRVGAGLLAVVASFLPSFLPLSFFLSFFSAAVPPPLPPPLFSQQSWRKEGETGRAERGELARRLAPGGLLAERTVQCALGRGRPRQIPVGAAAWRRLHTQLQRQPETERQIRQQRLGRLWPGVPSQRYRLRGRRSLRGDETNMANLIGEVTGRQK